MPKFLFFGPQNKSAVTGMYGINSLPNNNLMTAIKGMAPLLQVFDMPTSIHFYRNILGFEIIQSSPGGDDCDWCLLKLQEIGLMLNTAYEKQDRPAVPDPSRVAAHDDTALYFGCPNVESTYQYLISKGVALKPPYITGYGFKAIDIADPDGYHLCFHWPAEK